VGDEGGSGELARARGEKKRTSCIAAPWEGGLEHLGLWKLTVAKKRLTECSEKKEKHWENDRSSPKP